MTPSPLRLIVMGVSGCGKSTMATALAAQLGLDMVDGDDLQPTAGLGWTALAIICRRPMRKAVWWPAQH